jgi:iron complex outermembrane receptor protein
MHHYRYTPLMAALLTMYASDASARQDSSKPISTVVVEGNRPSSLPTNIPTTIESITGAEIARTINALDGEDALKYLPSLLVRKRYNGDYNHAVLSTRASGTGNSARSAVYADGILLSNYLGNGATFAPRWGMVSPEEIERVDVLYGPFSAAYGGNSAGAVVDYVTRMPQQFEAHGKLILTNHRFKLYDTNERFNGGEGSFSLGDRVGAWSWFIDLSRNNSHGQPLTFVTRPIAAAPAGSSAAAASGAVPGLDRSDRPWLILGSGTQYDTVQDHAKLKLAYEFSPILRAAYTVGWWKNDAENRPASYLRDGTGQAIYSGPVNIGGRAYTLAPTDFSGSNETLDHLMQGFSLRQHSRQAFDWELAASRYDYRKDQLRAPTVSFPGALDGGAGRLVNQGGTGWTTFAAKGVWRPRGEGQAAGAHTVEFGYQREAYTLASVESATANWLDGAAGARNNAFGGRTSIDALYAQDAWKFAPAWKTVLGLRAERWQARDGRTSNASSTVLQGERRETWYSPKAALSWQTTADWSLKASLGRAVRMPTVSELYQGGINGSGQLINNDPTLKPEKSWTGELSAERRLDQGSLRLTAFGEHTVDALYSQTNVLVTPNVTNVQNVDAIRTRGLELAYAKIDVLRGAFGHALDGIDFNSSLTWTDSTITRNDKFPASVGKRQPRIPAWRATGVTTWHASERIDVTVAARYSGAQFSTLDNSDPNGFAYQGASKYFTVDTRATWRFAPQWTAALGIENLNNYQYWNFHPYPQRTLVAELRFDL